MKDVLPTSLIDVQQLRIGMFVHLDMGWMSHPFPLSSFKITSADQIATIRGLGKPRVRWSPDKSDPDALDAADAPQAGAAAGEPARAAGAIDEPGGPLGAEAGEPLPDGAG